MAMMDDDDGGPGAGREAEVTQSVKKPLLAARQDETQSAAMVPDESLSNIHTYIGSRLRQAFDDIASQPVPDRFLQLMRDLDKA